MPSPSRLRALPVALLAAFTVVLAGCGDGTLIHRLQSPFGSICGLIVLILDIVAIVEVINSNRDTGSKVLWCLVIFFFPVGGLLLYWIFGKK